MSALQTGPYRANGLAPVRHVCLVCFKTYAFGPSACPTCGLERLPIDRQEVCDAVLDEALRRTDVRDVPIDGWKQALFAVAMLVPVFRVFAPIRLWSNNIANPVRAALPSYTGDQLVDFLKMKPK